MTLPELQNRIQDISVDKEWFDGNETLPELVAHVHSELSEVIEELRRGGSRDFSKLKVLNQGRVSMELADVLIGTLMMCNFIGIDADGFVEEKLKVLNNREPRSFFNKGDRKD